MNQAQFDKDLAQFREASLANGRTYPAEEDLLPVLDEDSATHTGKDYSWDYVLHCCWAARMLAKDKPFRHVDFGSYSYFAGICAAFMPCEFYDLRPLNIAIAGLKSGSADLTALPFDDNSIGSVSCLHVMEHVGLGRYGDELNVNGDFQAASELNRVTRHGGHLLMVLPMSNESRVVFNAHRIYTMADIPKLFPEMKVAESTFLYGGKENENPPGIGDFTGCFDFVKP